MFGDVNDDNVGATALGSGPTIQQTTNGSTADKLTGNYLLDIHSAI